MTVELTPDGTRGRPFPRTPVVTALMGLHQVIYRVFGVGSSWTLLLTTVGSKTGQERTNPLAYFRDGPDAWLIIASAGGDRRHPAWYRNLVKNPDRVWIQVGRRRLRVTPELLRGAERQERWARITSRAKNFAEYQRQTDREIPLV